MKKKKKGFTLIELLAIIVILAIIAVITVPIILNIIENSKRGAVIDSAYGYKDSINKYYVTELAKNSEFALSNGVYTVNNDGSIKNGDNTYTIPFSGTKPSGGSITLKNNEITDACIIIDEYAVTYEDGKFTTNGKGICDGMIGDEPTLSQYEFVKESDGDIKIGDEIIFGTENFYVVSVNANKVVLLAKYNLYVGNKYDRNTETYTPLDKNDSKYGLQSEITKYVENKVDIGVVPFSKTVYGYNEEYDEAPQGTIEEPTNEKYSIAYYVKEYVNKLKEMGAPDSITGRLLLDSDISQYDCTFGGDTCEMAPYWLQSSSYWLGSGYSSSVDGLMEHIIFSDPNYETYNVDEADGGGVRPVIEINLSDIKMQNT